MPGPYNPGQFQRRKGSKATFGQTIVIADAGTGVDALAIAVVLAIADSGVGTDVGPTPAAVDVVSVLMETLKTVVDAGTGVDAVSVSVSVPVGDAGSGFDAVAIAALLSVVDSGAGVDIVVRFEASVRIATISFGIKRRSMSFKMN